MICIGGACNHTPFSFTWQRPCQGNEARTSAYTSGPLIVGGSVNQHLEHLERAANPCCESVRLFPFLL